MTYHVILTDRAQADVERIVDWLSERSPQGAHTWLVALEAAMKGLEERPDRFSPVLQSDFPDQTIRQRVFKTRNGHRYWLLYYIDGSSVPIVHVYGAGQDPLTP